MSDRNQSFRMSNQNQTFVNRSRLSMTPGRKPAEEVAELTEDSLLKSLKILQRYHKLQKQRAPKTKKGNNAIVPANESDFEFTSNMFARNNTEALLQVTYLILVAVYPVETATKFRDCWPTHGDRKVESEYRKLAYTWVVDICEKYPQCFECKPQFAYFVTPSGPKCVRFLTELAQCGLYILAERMQASKGKPLLDNPKFTTDPILKGELTLKDANEEAVNSCLALLKQTALLLIYIEENHAVRQSEKAALAETIAEQEARIGEFMKRKPELFVENAAELLHSTSRFSVADGRAFDAAMLTVDSGVIVEDKLLHPLKDELRQKLMRLRADHDELASFLAEDKPLLKLLHEVVENWHLVVDAKKFPNLFPHKEGSLPDASQCLKEIPILYESIRSLFPKIDNLNRKFPNLGETSKQLVGRVQSLIAEASATLETGDQQFSLKDDILFLTKVEEIALEGTDWNAFLPETSLEPLNVSEALKLTPARPRDFTQTTGLTPNFDYGLPLLPTSVSKLDRLRDAIRISSTPTGLEHARVTTLRNQDTVPVKRNLLAASEEESFMDTHLSIVVTCDEDDGDSILNRNLPPTLNESIAEIGILEDSMFQASFVSLDGFNSTGIE